MIREITKPVLVTNCIDCPFYEVKLISSTETVFTCWHMEGDEFQKISILREEIPITEEWFEKCDFPVSDISWIDDDVW